MLYLVRHGECQANAQHVYAGQYDSPLTDRGRLQAQEAASSLHNYGIIRIVTSPLSRAAETAEIIARELGGIQVQVDHRMMEYDTGSLTGRPEFPPLPSVQFTRVPGAENPTLFARRVSQCVFEYGEQAGSTLFVAHAGVGRIIQALEHTVPYDQFHDLPALGNVQVMQISFEAISRAVIS